MDEIDLAQGSPLSEGIVISGRMTVGEDVHDIEVNVQELFRFEGSNRPDVVAAAEVSVVNNEGQVLLLDYDVDERKYLGQSAANNPDFRVEDRMSFSVNVVTPDGSSYFSEPEGLAPALPVGEVITRPDEIQVTNLVGVSTVAPAIRYSISSSLRYPDGQPAFLRWYLTEMYQQSDGENNVCYIQVPFERFTVKVLGSAGSFEEAGGTDLGTNEITFKYAEGNYMIVRQETISERAFDYFNKIRQDARTELSIFEPPGGPIIGNMRASEGAVQNVYGYFYAARSTYGYVPVTPEEAGFPDFGCPLMTDMPPPVNRCNNCLSERNSTIIRPEWWDL